MNINEMPTPEMDGLEINIPDTRTNAIMALNAVIGKGKDLERRLIVVRAGFKNLIDAIEAGDFSNGEYSRREMDEAINTITQTAPKP